MKDIVCFVLIVIDMFLVMYFQLIRDDYKKATFFLTWVAVMLLIFKL